MKRVIHGTGASLKITLKTPVKVQKQAASRLFQLSLILFDEKRSFYRIRVTSPW